MQRYVLHTAQACTYIRTTLVAGKGNAVLLMISCKQLDQITFRLGLNYIFIHWDPLSDIIKTLGAPRKGSLAVYIKNASEDLTSYDMNMLFFQDGRIVMLRGKIWNRRRHEAARVVHWSDSGLPVLLFTFFVVFGVCYTPHPSMLFGTSKMGKGDFVMNTFKLK
jgi:hypothetical protein